MKQLFIAFAVLLSVSACNKGAFKKAEGSFKVNGNKYSVSEDMISAGYYNGGSLLQVTLGGGPSSTFAPTLVVDLNKVNTVVPISKGAEGFTYFGANSAVQYFPISGEYKITSHSAGNPASQHTEGTFSFKAVSQYNSTDTVEITEGYFYVNNY
ncbi:MAG: hypothetical protein JNL95_15140 [Chitinophagales bacterium]|nr:hypothetical protein [Chitinophagales bacterium]